MADPANTFLLTGVGHNYNQDYYSAASDDAPVINDLVQAFSVEPAAPLLPQPPFRTTSAENFGCKDAKATEKVIRALDSMLEII